MLYSVLVPYWQKLLLLLLLWLLFPKTSETKSAKYFERPIRSSTGNFKLSLSCHISAPEYFYPPNKMWFFSVWSCRLKLFETKIIQSNIKAKFCIFLHTAVWLYHLGIFTNPNYKFYPNNKDLYTKHSQIILLAVAKNSRNIHKLQKSNCRCRKDGEP